jgi:Amt family ammonium transporter
MLRVSSNRGKRAGLRLLVLAICTVVLAMFGATTSFAQSSPATGPTMEEFTNVKVALDTSWVLLTGFLVFFMQTGFALLETGIIRQTAAVNALLENFIDAGLTAIVWWAVGFGIAFGASQNGLFGASMFAPGIADMNQPFGSLNISVLTMFFFQFAFAATASTITTGAMAERTDFIGDLIYSAIIAAIIYPVVVHWVWGGGWLAQQGFLDFAGSNVVHTVGGVIALIGAWMLGPRAGRVWGKPPRPHSLAYATLGTMILWLGWYGFNPGSTLGIYGQGGVAGLVVLNTTLGAAAGALTTMFAQYFMTKKWDLLVTLNGSLAGLVAVTASCAFISPSSAILIGLIGGLVMMGVAALIEKLRIDDAVGAFAVHGGAGIFGVLAVGLFAESSLTVGPLAGSSGLLMGGGTTMLGVQILGSLSTIAWVTVTGLLMFGGLKLIKRLRVSHKADEIGIDFYEHGASVWPDVLPHIEDGPGSRPGYSNAPAVGD